MGFFLIIILAAGVLGGLVVTTLTGLAAIVVVKKRASRQPGLWRSFGIATLVVMVLVILAIRAIPKPETRPGSDYDVASRNLFITGLAYTSSPGMAALLSAAGLGLVRRKESRPPTTET